MTEICLFKSFSTQLAEGSALQTEQALNGAFVEGRLQVKPAIFWNFVPVHLKRLS